ncbi:unnamed protein product [Urochloa decumbens]|uniref:SKP1-like protein n=1 Tax=Urochloa decumbens TaxID=240449 RepID=A0ABC9FBJ3_9POAL
MAAEKGEKAAEKGEMGVKAADEEKGSTAAEKGGKGATAADSEKGAAAEEKGVTAAEKGEKGAAAADGDGEKGATAEGKGKKRDTAADEKGAAAEWEPRRWRSTRKEGGEAVDKEEEGAAAAASEGGGEKAAFFFSAAAAEKVITVVSSEGKPFKVAEEAARLSSVLADMIDNGCAGGSIPLTNVTARALATVIKYCDKHAAAAAKSDSDHGGAEGSSSGSTVNTAACDTTLAEWDRKLVDKLTMDALFDLLLAANFLDIKGLLGVASQKVADTIQSKSPAQVRTIFGIANDFTPEEEAEIRKESPWAYEEEEA